MKELEVTTCSSVPFFYHSFITTSFPRCSLPLSPAPAHFSLVMFFPSPLHSCHPPDALRLYLLSPLPHCLTQIGRTPLPAPSSDLQLLTCISFLHQPHSFIIYYHTGPDPCQIVIFIIHLAVVLVFLHSCAPSVCLCVLPAPACLQHSINNQTVSDLATSSAFGFSLACQDPVCKT